MFIAFHKLSANRMRRTRTTTTWQT